MVTQVSTATIDLVADLTRPLVGTGALHKTEQAALTRILRRHTSDGDARGSVADVLTIGQTAEGLLVSPRTVSRMLKSGELEGVYLRPGSKKTLRIRRESVDALLAKQNGGEG